ncbi:hypothetical protein M8037_30855 [Sinorhizobium meliloti]|uniref:hypothetical protein n=1 Tax=Rhizobium meliloti TaxID=382 RepID=UPI002072E5C0|nr:hypothetical protein [Sinorhizobium meliloti]MCM5693069.1 hypothetical protein [Sinorhizobium meliloti]
MLRHVDFEPGKPEFVADVSRGGVQVPPNPEAAGPLGGHGPLIRPIFDENCKAARLAEHDRAVDGMCAGKIFDGFAINGLKGSPHLQPLHNNRHAFI